MILKIELTDNQFVQFETDGSLYFTGPNRKMLWQIYRSIYYYFNKAPSLSTNIYGKNDIEVSLDDELISKKNTHFFTISSRESLYNQMIYKKGTLLFEMLNQMKDDFEVNRAMDRLNNEQLRISIILQKYLQCYSDSLTVDLREFNYLELLKSQLVIGYEENQNEFPLVFMDTDTLVDEFLNLLKKHLSTATNSTWLVLSNLDSFISEESKEEIMSAVKKYQKEYDLVVIYFGKNLSHINISSDDVENVVVCVDDCHQLLPYDQLRKSVSMHYPNELDYSKEDFTRAIARIVPNIGNGRKIFLNPKDLVLLKIVNVLLNYETFYDLEDQLLTEAETKFLK